MKTYQSTTRRARAAAVTLSLAIAAGLLETVAGALMHPDPQALAARRQSIAAQADQVARARALAGGEVKSAAADTAPRI